MPDQGRPATWQDLIRVEAKAAGVPEPLALSLAEQESSFNPNARGSSGEIGLFQLMPNTAKEEGVDPADPFQNIRGGLSYLKKQLAANSGDVQKALGAYNAGPGRMPKTTYVQDVLGRLPKFQVQQQPAQAAPGSSVAPPPAPGFLQSILSSVDPRERQGRRNLAGAAGALGAGLATGGMGAIPAAAMVIGGAGLGGGGAETLEQMAHGEQANPSAIAGAAGQQALYESFGQFFSWPIKAVGRRVVAAPVYKNAMAALDRLIESGKSRISGMAPPALTASRTGRMVESVAQGPAKREFDRLGEEVLTSAKGGPGIPIKPLQDRLADLAQQITPMASHQQTPAALKGFSPAQVQAIAAKNPSVQGLMLPPEHPLPGTLDRIREVLTEASTSGGTIPFEEVHKIKTLLDAAVNWDKTAKGPAEQITKGFRQTLRQTMSSHQPYEQATSAYQAAVPLFRNQSLVQQLHKQAISNPEAIVPMIKGFGKTAQPTRLQMLFDVLEDYATKGGGQAQGAAAKDAVRAAWTHANLIEGNPLKLTERIGKLNPEFSSIMYGDQSGQLVLSNLKTIGRTLDEQVAKEAALKTSSLSSERTAATTIGDIARIGLAPTSSYGITSMARQILHGPKKADLLQWMAFSPKYTQMFVQSFTNPSIGLALADAARVAGVLDTPEAGPPKPRALSIPSFGQATPPPMPGR